MQEIKQLTEEGGDMTDQITQLAFQLADSVASSDIEILCAPVGGEPQTIEGIRSCWFDIKKISDPENAPLVATSVD